MTIASRSSRDALARAFAPQGELTPAIWSTVDLVLFRLVLAEFEIIDKRAFLAVIEESNQRDAETKAALEENKAKYESSIEDLLKWAKSDDALNQADFYIAREAGEK